MQESETIVVPLLGIVAAAVFGVSLLCGAGVVGISDINNAVSIGTPTAGVVDFVISNMNTMIVQTVVAFSPPEITNTSTATLAPTNTFVAFGTPTGFPLATLLPPGRTSRPPPARASTYTPLPAPTNTPKPQPATYTPTLNPTNTHIPTFTDTPIPPDTVTPIPPDTDTPIPPDTVTPIPPDTDTPIPPDTDTPVPPDTPTSGP